MTNFRSRVPPVSLLIMKDLSDYKRLSEMHETIDQTDCDYSVKYTV